MSSALNHKRKIQQDIEEKLNCTKTQQSGIRPFQYIASLFTTEQWTASEIELPICDTCKPLHIFI